MAIRASKITLSIVSTSVPGSLDRKLKDIADAGFQGIEIHETDFITSELTAEEVAALAGRLKLKITALQPFDGFEGFRGKRRDLAFHRLSSKLQLAKDLGAEHLIIGSNSDAGASLDEKDIIKDLSKAAKLAESKGVKIAYLAMPWSRHVTSAIQAHDLVARVNHNYLGIALDSYFALADGSNPARYRKLDGSKIFHVQLSDAPFANFDISHLKGQFGNFPGLGQLNLASFVRIVAKSGYQGAWSLARLSEFIHSPSPRMAHNGYRSLVNLLDGARRTNPSLSFPIPKLPARVYPSGFEFLEFAVDEDSGATLRDLLKSLCFRMERKHISKQVELWRQGAINIVINSSNEGFARSVFKSHGPSICEMGLRVKDAEKTVKRATMLGASAFSQAVGTGELKIPGIKGVGGDVIHFIDEKSNLHHVWDIEFKALDTKKVAPPAGLRRIDHLALTMDSAELPSWLLFFLSTFEMEKTSIANVIDPSGVISSQSVESPEGEVRLNLNGVKSDRTFPGSFLADRLGAGVQHIAFISDDIFETSLRLRAENFSRLKIPANYYDDIRDNYDLKKSTVDMMQEHSILYSKNAGGEYFQLYSQPIFKGFFIEIVQRRGDYIGYGARNATVRLAAQQQYLQSKTQNNLGKSHGKTQNKTQGKTKARQR